MLDGMERPGRISPAALLLLLGGLGSACGSATPPPATVDEAPRADSDLPPIDDDIPESSSEMSAPPPGPPEGSSKEGDPDAPVRDITPRECRALAGKYGELTRSDETAKLNPKLTDKQRAQASESIDAAARTLEGRWSESCEATLVGKTAEERAIGCAMSAKNVAAFDTCLNGPK